MSGFGRIISAFVVGALCGALFSCETVQGFGRDVETAGDAIEDTAHDASH